MQTGRLIRDFSNIGLHSPARRFPGFPTPADLATRRLSARQTLCLSLKSGDLVSLQPLGAPATLALIAFDADGRDGLAQVNLQASGVLQPDAFDPGALRSWLDRHGLDRDNCPTAPVRVEDLIVLKAQAPVTLWFIYPTVNATLVEGQVGGTVEVTVSCTQSANISLPEPLGILREEFTVTRGTAQSYEVEKGEFVQIIDIEGQQCSDFMAFRTNGLTQGREIMIDSTATRSSLGRAYPAPGLYDKFFDPEMQPILRVVQDTCGRHDTFGLACTARSYEERGFPGHVNCSDNISDAMARFGVARRAAWPAINFFWNTWIDAASHQMQTEESHSRPGDYVVMEALDNLVCVSTACPDDLDPINGWNPTDVHVRIYRADSSIPRAIAYRAKEDQPMTISREGAFHRRLSALTQDFAPARDLWTPVAFPQTGTIGEYWACREKATLQDMSGLRKYDIIGPDAERLLQAALTRDVSRLAVHRGTYALICDDTGSVIDDGTLFRLGPDLFRWCCGSEESARVLENLSGDAKLNVRLHDMSGALVNLALQGPRSRNVLQDLVFTQPQVPDLGHLKWFGVTTARLRDRDGAPFMLSRTGYTGELGYELFCAATDAEAIWDALIETGRSYGLTPMGSAALEVIRIEAGLAAAGAEFAPGTDAFEAGLGFAVNLQKADFLGKAALTRNAANPRRVLKGLTFACNDVPRAAAPVFAGERQVGVVTSATRSPTLECSIAMARLAVEHSRSGTALEVGLMDGHLKRLPCEVVDIPFIDPKREKARA